MRNAARGTVLSCLVLVAGVLGLAWADPTAAASTFSASAGGEIARVGLRLEPGIVVEQLLDPGVSVAQVSLDSLGVSTGFASNPFPGTLVDQLPSLVDSLTAGASDVPDLPLVVSSSFPATTTARSQIGPVVLESQSHRTDGRATASDGVNSTVASAEVDGSDTVTARAETTVGSVQAPGGLVQLSGIRSFAQARQGPGGEVERSSDLSIGRLSILGQSFALTSDGIELFGTAVPLGLDLNAVLQPLLEQLSGQGIKLRLLEPLETPEGVVSAGVELSYEVDVPQIGHVTITTTFGRTFASVSNRARGGIGSDGGVDSVGLPSGDGVGISGSPLAPSDLGSLPELDAGSPAAGPSASGEQLITASVADRTRVSYVFPALLVAAGALGLATSLFRHFGVKLAWTS